MLTGKALAKTRAARSLSPSAPRSGPGGQKRPETALSGGGRHGRSQGNRSRPGHAPRRGHAPRPGHAPARDTPQARARVSSPRLGLPALLPDATLGLLTPSEVGAAATLPRCVTGRRFECPGPRV